jgi:hypothetical protein
MSVLVTQVESGDLSFVLRLIGAKDVSDNFFRRNTCLVRSFLLSAWLAASLGCVVSAQAQTDVQLLERTFQSPPEGGGSGQR